MDALKDDLEKQYGIEVYTVAIDLTEQNAIDKIDRATQDLDIGLIVLAAGTAVADEFIATTPERNIAMAHLNMVVPMQLVRVFANKMAPRQRGVVLLVSSLFAYQGIPYVANYAATKAYILVLGEALHVELKKYGIDVSVLSPGLTDTDMPTNMPLNFSKLPLLYQSPQQVTKIGVKALGRKPAVVSGFINKFYAWQNRLIPRSMPVSLFGFLIRRAFLPHKSASK